MTIAGHATSLRIEPLFWRALVREAERLNLPTNALVARIDAERLAQAPSPNLASAIRQWLFSRAMTLTQDQ
ncbi:ribbon-helix-helix domain-containing protein [Sphingomonas lacunae]|uniref:ribbon-helix-helix domain-containing protein n=1 Tax=Sphingomonas lacunae TaxID=2698828 RepID=UPI003CCD3D50